MTYAVHESIGNAETATYRVSENMALYGATGEHGEVNPGREDPRPFPDETHASQMIHEMIGAITDAFEDTCMEEDGHRLLWGVVNALHAQEKRLERRFDDLRSRIETLQASQDGSEVQSLQLEETTSRAHQTSEKSETFRHLLETADSLYTQITGQPWPPASGSKTGSNHLTGSVIAARDFLAAEQRKKNDRLLPEGTRVAIAGGMDCVDVEKVWAALDRVHRKHDHMVLFHGGAAKGVDLMASRWAATRKVPQVIFRPDWKRYGKLRAGFKRNEAMLDALPIGLIVFDGPGLTDNLADKARAMGIPLLDMRTQTRSA